MPGSIWRTARQRDFRGGETQAALPEEVGRNQLLRMENAMILPNGWLSAAHQIETQIVTGAPLGAVLIPSTDGTYTICSAPGNGIVYERFFDSSTDTSFDMTAGTQHAIAGSRIVGLNKAVKFLGHWYCPNPNSDDTKDGILDLTLWSLINIASSTTATVNKLRVYMNRLWAILSDGKLRISDNGDATTWNALNVVLLPNSEPIIDFLPVQGGVIVYGATSIYAMYGSTFSDITFVPLLPEDDQGASGRYFTSGAVKVAGTVYILSTEGIYAANLNGAQLIPHQQKDFFRAAYAFLSDATKTISAVYLARFRAIVFTWPEVYQSAGKSLVFYIDGAYSKLNWLLPTVYPYILALNDSNTDFLIGSTTSGIIKSEFPSPSDATILHSAIQTRHEDCDASRDKVWSCLVIVTGEVAFGVSVLAYVDYSDSPVTVASSVVCSKGENEFWLDDVPRGKTLSMVVSIDSVSSSENITIVSDDDSSVVLTDENGNELVATVNPRSWTIKELRLRYREAGPDI
jgi:hypothetical protein